MDEWQSRRAVWRKCGSRISYETPKSESSKILSASISPVCPRGFDISQHFRISTSQSCEILRFPLYDIVVDRRRGPRLIMPGRKRGWCRSALLIIRVILSPNPDRSPSVPLSHPQALSLVDRGLQGFYRKLDLQLCHPRSKNRSRCLCMCLNASSDGDMDI